MFDDNSSQELDFDEFSQILNCISSRFGPDLIKKLFDVFDKSHDAKISKNEFQAIMD